MEIKKGTIPTRPGDTMFRWISIPEGGARRKLMGLIKNPARPRAEGLQEKKY